MDVIIWERRMGDWYGKANNDYKYMTLNDVTLNVRTAYARRSHGRIGITRIYMYISVSICFLGMSFISVALINKGGAMVSVPPCSVSPKTDKKGGGGKLKTTATSKS